MPYTIHKYGPLQPMSRCVYFFRFNSTRPMSRLQVVFRGRFVCDENIYYTITCSCVYPATVFGEFRWDCLLKSDNNFGDPRFNDIIMRNEYLGARQLRRAQRKQSTVTRQSRLTVTTQNKGASKAVWDANCLLNQLSPAFMNSPQVLSADLGSKVGVNFHVQCLLEVAHSTIHTHTHTRTYTHTHTTLVSRTCSGLSI